MKKIYILSFILLSSFIVQSQTNKYPVGINNPITNLEFTKQLLDDCSSENPNDGTFESGYNVSATNANGITAANDLIVEPGESFTINQITASIFTNGGIDTVDVNYYTDLDGLPDELLGSETSLEPSSQVVIGNNFDIDVYEMVLDLTPFTFTGQFDAPTTYWVELVVVDNAGSADVFWTVTTSTAIGNPAAQFGGITWSIPFEIYDGVYIFSGECDPLLSVVDLSTIDFKLYPNPASSNLTIESAAIMDSFTIYSLLGQKVLQDTVEATSATIDINNLSSGTYIIEIEVENNRKSFQLIKD